MDAIWKASYPTNVQSDLNIQSNETFLDLWANSVKNYPDQIAFLQFGSSLTFREVDQLSLKFACYLNNHTDLKVGDRFAIILPNVLQYPVALLGAWRAGVVVVNINPLYSPRELLESLKDSGSRGLIILENFAHTLSDIRSELKDLKTIIMTQVGDLLGFFKKTAMNFWVRYGARLIPKWQIDNTIKFQECLITINKNNLINPHAGQTALLQYTGGTTGISKAAILTHHNLLANTRQILAWIQAEGKIRAGQETVVTAIPLYHIFALTANALTFMALGSKNVLILNPKQTGKFIRILSKNPFTVITGVNTLYRSLLNYPTFKKLDFKTLKISIAGGMALQESVAEQWQQITGCPLMEGYGLTEASPVVSFNRLDLKQYNHSIGLPLPNTEISIRDPAGVELGVDQIGELSVRGPQVMQAYWNRPAETAQAFWPDRFFKTGDLARIDAQGYLYLIDRKKDMILVSGFKVYPNEVENIIAKHPGVLEVGVVGEKNDQGDEQVVAYIVSKDPNLTGTDLIEFCKKQLAHYKIPKTILFRSQLPKSMVGKVLRRKLSESEKN